MIYIFFIFFYTIISMYNTIIVLYDIDNQLHHPNNVTVITNVNNEANQMCDFYLYYNFSNDPELFIPIILVPNLSHTNIQNRHLE